jgi:hypothetical protein
LVSLGDKVFKGNWYFVTGVPFSYLRWA